MIARPDPILGNKTAVQETAETREEGLGMKMPSAKPIDHLDK
jgi:hypothetical protein